MAIKYKGYINLLRKYLLPLWPKLILLFVFMIIGIGLNLILPQIIRYYIDNVEDNSTVKKIIFISIGYISAVLLRLIISTVNIYISENLGWIASNKLRLDLMQHCIGLDMDFHKSHNTGEMVERIDGDVSFLANFLSLFVVNLIGNTALIVGILFMLFWENWILGTTLSILSLVILFFLSLMQNIATPYWVKAREKSALLFNCIEEHLFGREDICAIGAEEFSVNKLDEHLDEYRKNYRKASFVGHLSSLSVFSLFNIGDALSLGLGVFLFLKGSITIGTVYLIFNYAGLLYKPLEELRLEFANLQMIGASIKRITKLFSFESSITTGNEIIKDDMGIAVEVENLFFQYRENEKVLDNVSFKLDENKILGIMGHTGSGKTTLSQLILRLYEPQAGVIKINGKPINEYQIKSYREKVGMITQNVQIFNGSVRDNISLFSDEIDDHAVLRIMNELELEQWYNTLPEGLDSQIDHNSLSAGEAQLLSFMRIFMKNPKLIIFDEATSYIDPHTVHIIQNTMRKVLLNRTAIIIAHRLNTLSIADYILIFEQGRVKEYGERLQLEKDKNSIYHQLLRKENSEKLL